MSSNVLKRACALLDVSEEQVMSYHQYDDRIVLVVDYGLLGGKKHSVLLDELPEAEETPKRVTKRGTGPKVKPEA